MERDFEEYEKKYEIRHDRKSGKIKAFLIGAVATIAVGGLCHVKFVNRHTKEDAKEKQEKKWRAMNADADSISVDADKGHFYALKKVDQKAIDAIDAKLDTLIKKRQVFIDKANSDFTKAFNNRDVEGMKKAIADHADNINKKNAQGLTPLMVLLKESESAKSYACARALIPHADVNVQDNDGASAVEYAAVSKTTKGEVLRKEIGNRKNQQDNQTREDRERRPKHLKEIDNPTTYDELSMAITITRWKKEELLDSVYKVEVNKDQYSAEVPGYIESGNERMSGGMRIRGGSATRDGSSSKKVAQVRRFARTR